MERVIFSLKRRFFVPVVIAIAVCLWLGLSFLHYQSYWEGTIYRVQTVDLNLLHHTLPAALSQLIIEGNDEEIQKVLDSTFGLFGIIVTTPDGSSVVFKTNKVYRKESWQKVASADNLGKLEEPYDILSDPPPRGPMWQHASPRSAGAKPTGRQPDGIVLGRVYYVRSVIPPFFEDLLGLFALNSLDLPGAKRGYLYITLTVLGFTVAVLVLLFWRRREMELRQAELDKLALDLDVRKKALHHLSQELVAQKARKEWLEREADLAYRRALALKEALERLRDSLHIDAQPGALEPESSPSVRLRPPVHPPSSLLEEIEALLPELNKGARILKSQADQLQDHCGELERRHEEMKNVIEQVSGCASVTFGKVIQFRAVK